MESTLKSTSENRVPRKTIRLEPGRQVCILGYRGDGKARPVQIESLNGNLMNTRCLIRSSPARPFYRTYRLRVVDGILPLITDG